MAIEGHKTSKEAIERLIRVLSVRLIPLQFQCMYTTAEAEHAFSDEQFRHLSQLGLTQQEMIAATGVCRKTIYNRLNKGVTEYQNNKVAEFLKKWANSRFYPRVVPLKGEKSWEDLVESHGKGFKASSLMEILQSYGVISVTDETIELITDEVIGKGEPDLIDAGSLAVEELLKTIVHNAKEPEPENRIRQLLTWHEVPDEWAQEAQEQLSVLTTGYIRSCENVLAELARKADREGLERTTKIGAAAYCLEPRSIDM